MINVITVHDGLHEKYSAYVAGKPEARFGHDLEWAMVLRDTYGASIQHLIALEDEKVVGISPLFLCKPIMGGAHYQTSLFPSYFGPLYDSQLALDAILDAIISLTSTLQYAEIVSPTPLPEDKRLPYLEQLDFTYRLPLKDTLEKIYANFRRNYRRILRDPKFHEAVDLIVDPDGKMVGEFHRLYAHLYARKHGFIPHVEKLFRNIFSRYPNGTARIYLAKRHGKTIGGIFTFWKYGEVYCGWSAMDLSTTYYPMHFLIWKIIQDAVAEGYRWFNHGESPRENESLKLFKQGWGMEPHDTYRYFIPGQLAEPNVRLFDRFSWTKKIISFLPAQITSRFVSPLIRYVL
ncbi:MAG TPA: GNAT family N-acetyltransferase [Anaerolineales bacterium]|nr:GNAT family N-acetyltransferase [Anaerolineales bacterium]